MLLKAANSIDAELGLSLELYNGVLDTHLVQDDKRLDCEHLLLLAHWGSTKTLQKTQCQWTQCKWGPCKAVLGVRDTCCFAQEAVDSGPSINRGLGDSQWSAAERMLDLK